MSWTLVKNKDPFKLTLPKIKPLKPLKPLQPLKPLRPLKPLAPLGYHYRWKDDK
jgi:hypothetical protein